MPIIATASHSAEFIPAPAGVHSAVCVDVVDLGVLEVTYSGQTKRQHKIRIVWQIDEDMESGKPFIVQRRYTLSLHEKASLRRDLESWRGRPFTESELEGFDVETVIGVPCMLNIIHQQGQSGTFANVTSIMRLAKGINPVKAHDYIRVCDRAPEQQAPESDFGNITDDDIPF